MESVQRKKVLLITLHLLVISKLVYNEFQPQMLIYYTNQPCYNKARLKRTDFDHFKRIELNFC